MVSMFALIGSISTLLSKTLGRYPIINVPFIIIFAIGRILIPLSCTEQPRFTLAFGQQFIGLGFVLVGVLFMSSILTIVPWPHPERDARLVTDGMYSLVRNPIYLGEVMWTFGWSFATGSVIGILLVPFWWGGMLLLIMLEEDDLERTHGDHYLEYKERVGGRMIPGLPI